MMETISVVIPAHNEGENLVDTVACVLDHAGTPEIEVIVVADDCTDGSANAVRSRYANDAQVLVVNGSGLGVAGARNRGATEAQGWALVFLDGHCYIPPGALEALIEPLNDQRVGMTGPAIANLFQPDNPPGCGATWGGSALDMQWLSVAGEQPYPVPLLPGGCQAMRRADFERLGGFDGGMGRWGSEDFELSLRVWLAGLEVVAQPRALIYHLFREVAAYPVDYAQVIYNRLRLALLHFQDERCARVFEHHKDLPGYGQAVMQVLYSDVMARRQELFALRCRDDDWLLTRFGMNI